MKTSSLAATGEVRAGLELLQSSISRELSLFDQSGGSLEDPVKKAVFIWHDSDLPKYKQRFL